MTAHTPTPWKACTDMDGRHQGFSMLADSPEFQQENWPYHPLIARTLHGRGEAPLEVARANAAHIVKCVNAHDYLVEALKILVKQYDSSGDIVMGGNLTNEGFLKGKAVLTKLGAL